MKTKICVTAKDIKNGRRMHCGRCPVARAIRRAVGPHGGVVMGCVYWKRNRLKHESELPQKVCNFIYKFDSKQKVKPFSFMLTVPAKVKR